MQRSFVYDDSTRLLWATNVNEFHTWDGAHKRASEIYIDGIGNWRLPRADEVQRSALFPRWVICIESSTYRNQVYTQAGWTATRSDSGRALQLAYSTGSCGRLDNWSESTSARLHLYLVREMDSIARLLVDGQLSPEAQLWAVAKELLRKSMQRIQPSIMPPAAPAPQAIPALAKGEFETTPDFNKRAEAERKRIEAANAEQARQFEQSQRDYAAQKAQAEQDQHDWHASLAKPEVQRKLAEQAFRHAIHIVFGSPVLKEIHYDADSGAFQARVGGSRRSVLADRPPQRPAPTQARARKSDGPIAGEAAVALPAQRWSLPVSIPTPINEAPGMKERLLDARTIPAVTFEIDTAQQKLKIAKYELVTDEVKMAREFEQVKQRDSLDGYQDFISRYPKTVYAERARQGIKELEARDARRRQEVISRKAEEERARHQEARARAEREKRGCRDLYVGKAVKANLENRNVLFNYGHVTVDALITGINAAQGVASARVTSSHFNYGHVFEARCADFE
jgi:hypothetical protein